MCTMKQNWIIIQGFIQDFRERWAATQPKGEGAGGGHILQREVQKQLTP